jgi:DNA-binding transcriptional ArsR family regulator
MINSKQEIKNICSILDELVGILNNSRRIEILNLLEKGNAKTFMMLRAESGISTGSLHHHLAILERAGLIAKNKERPAKYFRTDFLDYIKSLVKNDKTGIVSEAYTGQERIAIKDEI